MKIDVPLQQNSQSPCYIGLMSGTSMDGVDAVLVELGDQPRLLSTAFLPYARGLHEALQMAATPSSMTLSTFGALDREVAATFAKAALLVLEKSDLKAQNIQAIGSHGQTIYHAPQADPPFSLQLGDPNTIAQETGITTVADFRRRDIAAGGQGAPFAPLFHHAFFASPKTTRVIVNIGGIANISILGQRPRGYDTGPGNVLLDAWVQHIQGQAFDENGQWAQTGTNHPALLSALKEHPFFQQSPPKSTGVETFNRDWLESILQQFDTLPPADIQHTLSQLTAQTIAAAIAAEKIKPNQLYVCGGGAFNLTLMQHLEAACKISVTTTADLGIPPQWLEATGFAWLAQQTLQKNALDLSSITGAKTKTLLGGVYFSA